MTETKKETLFENVRVYDGQSSELSAPTNVLVEDNLIKKITDEPIKPSPEVERVIIKGDGRTLMPGMIDAHWHMMMTEISFKDFIASPEGYINLVAAKAAENTLMRGFTTIRDAGGNCFSIQKATDAGLINGPRLYPCGGIISQTSGHGDMRGPNEVPADSFAPQSYIYRLGHLNIADGVPAVLQRVRENLRMGATQIKLAAGGGALTHYDPLYVAQYTEEELKAAVDAASDWDTYVMVHAYTPKSVQKSIRAGVKSIEHGHLLDEETMEMIKEHDLWLSTQPFLNDGDMPLAPEGTFERAKQLEMIRGTDKAYEMAKKFNVKLAWGTDFLFSPCEGYKQNRYVSKMKRWFDTHEILKMITHDNAQLIKLCGKRDPYPGKLGVVEEGALADLLLVNGNPLNEIDIIMDYEKNFVIIMKDGKIHKNITV